MDDRLRDLGRGARGEVERGVDVDAAWDEMAGRLGAAGRAAPVKSIGESARRRVSFGVLAGAAAVVVVVGALAVAATLMRGDEGSVATVEPTAPRAPTTPAESTIPVEPTTPVEPPGEDEAALPPWYAAVENARTDPAVMWAVPDAVNPGRSIDVHFAAGTSRGPGFVLERREEPQWEWRYAVSSFPDSTVTANVWSAEEFVSRNVEWDAGPAFDGASAHPVPLPDSAQPGRWRVCTVPDSPSMCAEFDVVNSTMSTAEETIGDYLETLTDRRWADAAELLGQGGLSLEQRIDVAALDLADGDTALASALETWCEVAECVAPIAVDTVESFAGDPIVAATFPSGAVATFTVHEWEGSAAVTGLPPLSGREALPIIAAATGASTVIAQINDTVAVWNDGETIDITVQPEVGFFGPEVVSDEYLVFYHAIDGAPSVRAVTFDGTVVCDVEGLIHRITRRPDGTYVASAERPDTGPTEREIGSGETPRPNEAIDCTTGERTPIDPITWTGEGSYRTTLRVADRQFDANYDAEGNGTVRNEDGIAIDGNDYASWHRFSPDAARVVYGIYGGALGPHLTTEIRSRDTTTGAELWTAQLDTPFGRLVHSGSAVLVALPTPDATFNPWESTSALQILNADDGAPHALIPTSMKVIHLN